MEELGGSAIIWIVLLLVVSGVQMAIGIGLGHRMFGKRTDAESAAARQYLQEVQQLASRMNNRVGEHKHKLGVINDELRAAQADSGGVTEAAVSKAAEQLFDVNRVLEAELEAVRRELAAKNSQLESQTREARTDALTGLVNRRAFDEELKRRFAQWQKQHVPLAVILLDVDHFKKFNDRHGHQAGDEVLREVAQAFARSMRDMDVVARYGGEEFCALLPATNLPDAKILIEQVREAIEATIVRFGGAELKVTASLGLAQAMNGDDEGLLVSRSDAALYAAKAAGRNRSYFHNGRQPEPVKPESAASESATAVLEPAPARLSGTPSIEQMERRKQTRRDFRATHFIAPYVHGMVPSPQQFREVFCIDVSSAGFSFVTDDKPTFEMLVVELGAAPNLIYLSARIIYCRPSNDPEMPKYKVGCRFVGRLQI